MNFGKNKAERYTSNISFVTLLILTAISSIAILYFKNIAIFLGVIFLWILYLKEEKLYKNRNRLYELIKEEKEANIKYQETIENKIN